MSHLLAMYYAKTNGWPYVFIFEDDAWPNTDAAKRLRQAIEEADKLSRSGAACRFILCGNSAIIKSHDIGNDMFYGID